MAASALCPRALITRLTHPSQCRQYRQAIPEPAKARILKMGGESQSKTTNDIQSNNRSRSGTLGANCRVVYVAVPESVFNHAKAQAYLSGLGWSKYVERLLADAKPLK
jgi:hypothetical protein